MTAGARAKRAEASEDLEYSISTLESNGKLLLDEMKERRRGKGVNENLIAIALSHSQHFTRTLLPGVGPCSMLSCTYLTYLRYGILDT